ARIKAKKARELVLNKPLKDKAIFDALFKLLEKIEYSTVFIYLSFGTEVDTKAIVDRLFKLGKTVCVPKIVDGKMKSVKIDKSTELIINDYGIKEPILEEELLPDLAIVPMVAFNEGCYRVGYGKGYYDRYFSSINCDVLKIGVAYEEQKVCGFDIDEYDVPCDIIITDDKIYGELK
ncbi:MAG: 5-formyltetrahydrofolate cyclo-ligase, partial [Clostridia bacterium]|nr:5-formyltetrahydrofolate cyclo-ligase [Clostridia bacterium]